MLSQLNQIITQNANKRLNLEEYFMSIALITSQLSPSVGLNVGFVIVRNNTIISMGHYEYISNIQPVLNPTSDLYLKSDALMDCVIYITHYPSANSLNTIFLSGLKNIVYLNDYHILSDNNNDKIIAQKALEYKIFIRKINE